MSRFASAVAAGGLSETLAYFGQSPVYSPIDGPDVTLSKAVFSPETTEQIKRHGIVLNVRKMTATIGADPASDDGGVADVTERATVTVNDEIWPITHVMEKTDAYTVAALERPEGIEHAHEGFRGPT